MSESEEDDVGVPVAHNPADVQANSSQAAAGACKLPLSVQYQALLRSFTHQFDTCRGCWCNAVGSINLHLLHVE